MKFPLGLLLFLSFCSSYAQTINVSPDGAIRTLTTARDAARAQRRSGVKGPITITIHSGTYYLPETLVLGPEDSDTLWTAPHGEHPVISGGRILTGWTENAEHRWVAKVEGPAFHQLFIDGTRATRARTPNSGFFRIDGQSSLAKPFELHYRGSDIRKEWAEAGDVEAVAYLAWSDLRMPIRHVYEASRTATLAGNPQEPNREVDARYIIENAADALDAPGEWYLDQKKQLVTYIPLPGQQLKQAQAIAPALEQLVVLKGDPASGSFVKNVTFEGLTFEDAEWKMGSAGYADMQAATPAPSAIEATGSANFTVAHCTIAHSGGYAIFLGHGSSNSKLTENEIFDMGAGGIKVGEPALAKTDAEKNYGNTILGNNIHDLGRVFVAGIGIWVLQSSDNKILHNHVHDLYYTAISVGWTWGYGPNQCKGNLIAFNHLHAIGKEMLSDMGGIYTLGIQPGTIIRNNLVHDVTSFTYGGWGIYTDEGSSEILIEKNVVYHCKSSGFHQHYGRDNIVRNNIFALNHDYQLMRTRAEDHNSFTFEHNIVYFNEGSLLGTNWTEGQFKMHDNFYFDTRNLPILFAGSTFSDWQAHGHDQGSKILNPLFVNAGNYDFRLRLESPAIKDGFQPIDISSVGPTEETGADAW